MTGAEGGRVGPICVGDIILLVFDADINQLGVRHFSRFLRSGLLDNSQSWASFARGSSAMAGWHVLSRGGRPTGAKIRT